MTIQTQPVCSEMLKFLPLLGKILAHSFQNLGITKVIAPEARGPVLGALAAQELRAGLILVRKDGGNHPGGDTLTESSLMWRGQSERFMSRSFDLDFGDHVLVVDDWVTTGSTIRAVVESVSESGARYHGSSVIVNKADATTISDLHIKWLVCFDELSSCKLLVEEFAFCLTTTNGYIAMGYFK